MSTSRLTVKSLLRPLLLFNMNSPWSSAVSYRFLSLPPREPSLRELHTRMMMISSKLDGKPEGTPETKTTTKTENRIILTEL